MTTQSELERVARALEQERWCQIEANALAGWDYEALARAAIEAHGDIRDQALEEAAKVAENSAKQWREFSRMSLPIAPSPIINEDRAKTSEGIAEAIRRLKSPKGE